MAKKQPLRWSDTIVPIDIDRYEMNQIPKFDVTSCLRTLSRNSFYEYTRTHWKTVVPEEPVWNWHIEYLCDELQLMAERVFAGLPKLYDLIINVPPGSTKSTIASVMFPSWVWSRMNTARFVCASYSSELSLDLAVKGRDIVESDLYRMLYPEVLIRDDQNTKSNYKLTTGGQRWSIGVGGSITGKHGHFLLVDDPINPKEAASEADLKAANVWMTDTLPSRVVDRAISPIILIMQRLHEDDPTGNWLERIKNKKNAKVKHICLPAEVSDDVKPASLKKNYKNGLFDPVRLSRSILESIQLDGAYAYAGQYLQTPIPLGGGMFKTDLLIEGVPPKTLGIPVRAWDKSANDGTGDWTVGVKMAKDSEGYYWILDVVRGRWNTYEREREIRKTAERDGRGCRILIEEEPGSSGKDSAAATIRNLGGFRAASIKPTGDKTIRADPLSCQVNAGTVRMKAGSEWATDLLHEMKFFPYGKFDDQVDAASYAFNYIHRKRIRLGSL